MDYEKDMAIDETGLDVEWLAQPRLMMKYARLSAETKRQADLMKEKLEVIRAGLDTEIRANPENFGIAKVTESAISSAIILQEEYQKASKELIDARYEQDMARYAVQAISDRKEALENLVRLHGAQYFAGPRIPRDLDKEWEAKIKQESVDSKVRIKRKRGTVD